METRKSFLRESSYPGMHELLAPLFYAVDYDSIAPNEGTAENEDAVFNEICSRAWVAGDAWALFCSVMAGVSKWYEWREASDAASRGTPSPLATHVQLNVPDGPVDMKPYVAPIVHACNRVQSTLLRTTDPLLWKHMQDTGIEPQIYGM